MATNGARGALRAIIEGQGVGVLTQPRLVESLLADMCPDQRRETHLLAGAQREGVPDELRTPSTVPPPLLRARLQQRLAENLSVTEEAARWAVETWAIALGVLAESEAQTGPSLRSSQPQPPPTRERPAEPTPAEPTPPVTPTWQSQAQSQDTSPWQTSPGLSQSWQTPEPPQAPAQPQMPAQPQTSWQMPPPSPPVQPGGAVWPPPVSGQGAWQMGGNDSGTGAMAALPPQLRGFNWGALWMNWIWAIGNSTWIGLLALIPYVGFIMAIVLGVKGNEWAWQNRRWNSIEEFQAQQKTWAIVGWVFFGLAVALVIIIMIVGASSNSNSQ